jgi:hypothetical protein
LISNHRTQNGYFAYADQQRITEKEKGAEFSGAFQLSAWEK